MMITPEEREKERLLLDSERKRTPDLFIRKPTVDDEATLSLIGINAIHGHRPIGYLKLMAQDFIVEEITRDGTVHTIDFDMAKPPQESEGPTYYVDLVKVGISTLEAKTQLAQSLEIDEKSIGYAGIKDRVAITSQTLSIRDLKRPEKLLDAAEDTFFLKNIRRGKGILVNGDLQGNRFTITMRTPETLDEQTQLALREKIEEIKSEGFWNFFYFQRFGACGTPRIMSHALGRLIIKGEYEATIRLFCTEISPNEIPYMNSIRQEISQKWGDWDAILALIDQFPLYFSYERAFIRHVKNARNDFLGALHLFPDQIRLWIYAYACYLFNRKLSELIDKKEVPVTLPFITSDNPNDWKPYRAFLEEDGVILPSRSFRDFPFIYIQSRTCPTLQPISIHHVTFTNHLAIFSFSLPKGSYATTFLMNFFTLTTGFPMVPGIPTEQVDARNLLGIGTLAPLLERFKKVLTERQAEIGENSPEE